MSFMVGGDVPDEYVPMAAEEMGFGDEDARALRWDKTVSKDVLGRFRVLVIGAGMSGILAAIRLQEAGIPYLVVEKNPAVGGTWYENSYPGCRVDVPNHFYSYSFHDEEWPKHFSTRDDLWRYFEEVTSEYGIRDRIRFETEVVAARFDDATLRWTARVRRADGAEEDVEVEAIVSAVGQLNRPKLPDMPGIDRFEGIRFHSAAWEHRHDLRGKRIAVVGTGASAFQFVPEIAKDAAEVVVFQRSAPWMFPTENYHDAVGDGQNWCLEHFPYYANWYRFWLFWTLSDGFLPALTVDPDWPHLDRSANAVNEEMRNLLVEYVKSQIGDDRPDLLAKVIPDYPLGGKRILRDNGTWLRTLRRPNVRLVTDPIRELTRQGVVTDTGEEFAVDVVVFATGFKSTHFLWPMELTGRGGVELNEQWGDDPRAYVGITIPNFPNLFCCYGPNTNLVHGGSIIFHAECQVRYILGCLKLLVENGHAAMEPRQDVHDAFNVRIDEANAKRTWGMPGFTSWYKNRKGRITQNWPFRLVDYWTTTRAPDPSDYVFHDRRPGASSGVAA
jgi:4-hydroxyacetophenone monooxygenase